MLLMHQKARGEVDRSLGWLQVQRLQDAQDSQTRNAIAECYTNGTFSKVLAFLRFHRRGRDSLTFCDVAAESALRGAHDAATAAMAPADKLATVAAKVQRGVWSECEELLLMPHARAPPAQPPFNEDLGQLPRWLPPYEGSWCVCVELYFVFG